MAVAISLLVFTVGAILAFAVHVYSGSVNWNIVGDILMGVGAFGTIVSFLYFGFGGAGGWTTVGPAARRRHRTVVVNHGNGIIEREEVDHVAGPGLIP